MKISDFISVCSLLKIYTYTYEGEHYVFFYDVLIELSKYYLIHKIVEDEYKSYNNKFIVKDLIFLAKLAIVTNLTILTAYHLNSFQEFRSISSASVL